MPSYKLSQMAKTAKEYAPLIFQIGSILFLLFSAYLTSRIAPLADSNNSTISRVEAVEAVLNERSEVVSRYLVTEDRVLRIDDDIIEIKQSQIRMESKIDNFILRESRQ